MKHTVNSLLASQIEVNRQTVENLEKVVKSPKKYAKILGSKFTLEDIKAQLTLAKDFLRNCAI